MNMNATLKSMINNKKIKVAVVVLAIASLFCLSACGNKQSLGIISSQETSVVELKLGVKGIFSWFPDAVTDHGLIELAKKDSITEVYQMFSNKTKTGDVIDFAKAAASEGINLYGVVGDPQWALEPEAEELLAELDRIKNYNAKLAKEEAIKGIVIDVEPHSLDEWEANASAVIESFTKMLKNCYENRDGLEIYLCIPFYYDNLGFEKELETWINNYCDGFYIMNYSFGHESSNIEYEVSLSQKYNKKIVTIYEFNAPDGEEINKVNTYYGRTRSDLDNSFAEMSQKYNYDKLGVAYHEYSAYRTFLANSK